jgi:hypothetical protein
MTTCRCGGRFGNGTGMIGPLDRLAIWIIAAILGGRLNEWAMQTLVWDYSQPRW